MKMIFLTLIMSVSSLYAMQPAEKTINLVVGGQKFTLPQSVAFEAVTLKHLAQDLGLADEIELSAQISPEVMGHVTRIMRSYRRHKDLSGKALLDAIEKDVRLTDIPWGGFVRAINYFNFPVGKEIPLVSLLQACNYLDFPVGLELVARALARDESALQQFMQNISLKDLRPLVAKYNYLLNKKNLGGVDEKSYGFSIQDYLDYQPTIIAAKWNSNNLNLSKMRLNSLEGLGAIPIFSQLESLDLSSNQLRTLPPRIFNLLANLQVLNLSLNRLCELPPGVFNGLANLQNLGLACNQLNTLPVGVFNGLTNLKHLNLSMNPFKELPIGVFNGLTNLRNLVIQSSQLLTLSQEVFNGLVNLQVVYLHFNRLNYDNEQELIHVLEGKGIKILR